MQASLSCKANVILNPIFSFEGANTEQILEQ